jgi:hypothetical protein
MKANTQHQVVGVIEVVKAITYMEIGLSHEINLECKNLIEALHIIRMRINDIMANTEIDGEIWHDKLCARREAKSEPLVPR